MCFEMIVTFLLPLLTVISSTPIGSSNINDTCIFKEGDKFPSFIHHLGDNTEITLCSNDTCLCDGSNTGYKNCQRCCCAIRERIEGSDYLTFDSRTSSFTSERY